MERTSRFCTNCGSELDGGVKFCGQCGASTRQSPTPEPESGGAKQRRDPTASAAESEETPQQREDDAPAAVVEATEQPPGKDAPAGADVDWGRYSRFLKVDSSGGFSAIVTPLLIWTAAAGVLIWAVLGLISLRFDLSILNLEDLFFTLVIVIGIMLSVVANANLALRSRERAESQWQFLSYLPMLWAACLCVGLFIMIWQVWTDFAGGPNELRRAMFSIIGVGVCGMYGGYLSLVAIGLNRIYRVLRWVMYVLTAIIALEILDALWWGSRGLSGMEMWEHFLRAGLTVVLCAIAYAVIAFFMAQAKSKKSQTGMLVAYLVVGVIGFTLAVGALWDTFPPGAIRFVHGAIVIVTVATVGLLLVQHYHRKQDTGTPPARNAGVAAKATTTPAS